MRAGYNRSWNMVYKMIYYNEEKTDFRLDVFDNFPSIRWYDPRWAIQFQCHHNNNKQFYIINCLHKLTYSIFHIEQVH